jgi:negative regulator of PHO system
LAKTREQVLGEGSEGRVVLALQRSTGQLFALKRLKQQMCERDMDVQQAVFRCPHPNLAHVLAIIVSDKPIGLLYPYMDEDVDAYWRRHFKFLPVPEIVRIVHGTLAGVRRSHSIHLIHRDIKQSNVLLTFGAYRRVCLSDFGWCRGFHSESEGTTLMTRDAVTVTYRAPEIFLGSRSYDTSIDVWSCGIMLLELLRGARFITDVRNPPLGYIEKLVGPINESSWPGCSKFPKWACQGALIDVVPPKAWLAPFKGGRVVESATHKWRGVLAWL